ncbi:putative ribosomal protein S26e [Helianthus anomalus]
MFKRRNGRQNKHVRGHVKFIRCSNYGKCCPKDKAIKRFNVRNIVEQAAVRDVQEACAFDLLVAILCIDSTYLIDMLSVSQRRCLCCYFHCWWTWCSPRYCGCLQNLHHTIKLPNLSQELRCFQTVTCYQIRFFVPGVGEERCCLFVCKHFPGEMKPHES